MHAISLQGLNRGFGTHLATDDISLDIDAGQFVVLLGPSGCGKTTLLRLIAGFERPDSGCVYLHGRDVTNLPPGARELGMVFQSYALFPHMTVADNLTFGLKLRHVPTAECQRRLQQTSVLLGIEGLLQRKPAQLSGGQQQRVALGRAIIGGRRIILMDEPLSNLDAKLRQDMRREIKALASKLGITVVYVTHDQSEALSMGDRVVVMHQGRIEQDAAPAMLYERPRSVFVASFIGSPPMNLLPLESDGDGLRIAATRQPIALPKKFANTLMGLRPEHLTPQGNEHCPHLQAIAESVEYQGVDSIINCRVGNHAVAARLPGRVAIANGQILNLAWDPHATCFFDAQRGTRIDHPVPQIPSPSIPGRKDTSCNVAIS